jgi:hypothetical protein
LDILRKNPIFVVGSTNYPKQKDMKKVFFITLTALCLLSTTDIKAANKETKRERARAEVLARSRGFYKEVFMDGGVALT